jgi:hypothetical protein
MADVKDRYGRDSGGELRGEAGGGPAPRLRWYRSTRSDEKGKPLSSMRAKASRRRRKIANGMDPIVGGQPGGPGSVNWTPIGPSVVSSGVTESGRVMALAIGPSGTRVYVGAANGGTWLSTDGGATWNPLDDYNTSPTVFGGSNEADSLAVGAIAVSFGTPTGDDVFVGTGEADGSYDSCDGIGIRHLSGGTWALEATNLAENAVFSIVIDPDEVTPTTVFATTPIGIYQRPTTGSMATWTQVTSAVFTNSSGPATSMIVAGSGATKTYYVAFPEDNIYSSPDGATWTALTGFTGTGRIALAAGESDPSVIYAFCQDGTLFRLNGTSFSKVNGMPTYTSSTGSVPAVFIGGQGWYDIAIVVDPTNPNTVLLGGDRLSLFKGTITGGPGAYLFPFNSANAATPWTDPTWVGSNVHSDVHVLTYGLNSAGTAHDPTNVWVGCDGGLYQSTSSGGAGTYNPRNLGMAVTEFSYLAQRSDTDAVAFAGAQDNGTPRIFGEQCSKETAGGDGGGVVYDPNSAYRVMRQYVDASLDISQDGGASWSGLSFPPTTANSAAQNNAANNEGGSTNFVAPLAAVFNGTSTLAAFGTNRLWLSLDWGTTWNTLPTNTNPYTPATPNSTQDVLDGNSIHAITFASPTRIFVATGSFWPDVQGGGIWRFDQSGTTWTSTLIDTSALPAHQFTELSVENDATGSFYVTLGGGGVAHLYYYDGSGWHIAMPITVVDCPAHAVVVDPAHPNNIYVGTDVGCWKGVKSSGPTWTWTLFSQGLPEAAITDLEIHNTARLLRAATHGRSVWEYDLSISTGLDPDIYVRANYNDTGRVTAGARRAWVEGGLDPTNVGYILYHWMSADIKVRRSTLTGLPGLSSPVNYEDFAVNIGDYIDPTTHIETADQSGTDRIFVEVHNRSLNAVPGSMVQVLMLVADASAGLPPLPANYASNINAGNTSASWLAGSSWHFVDPSTPYRTLPGSLDVRTPQVVEYDFDFSTLGLPSTHTHVCLAALITTGTDQINSSNTDLDQLAMSDKHVCQRNTHLIAVPPGGGQTPRQGSKYLPQTILVDFHNALDKDTVADFVLDSSRFPGRVAAVLPKGISFVNSAAALADFQTIPQNVFAEDLHFAIGRLIEQIGEPLVRIGEKMEGMTVAARRQRQLNNLAQLDRSRIFVPHTLGGTPAIKGVKISARSKLTLAFTLDMPAGTKPGDRYRLDIIQQSGAKIVGGSTYVIAATPA